MNKEIKDRWLSKLRDGDFKQTPGQLGFKDSDGEESFCCLGVLCEVAVEDGIVTRDVLSTGTIQYSDNEGEVQRMVLPHGVIKWAGLRLHEENPEVEVEGFDVEVDGALRKYATMSELNDYAKKNFSEIADIIEARL